MPGERFDIAIVGAGPAGMAAAVEACSHGLSVVVLDEQPSPGGQIYRAVTSTPVVDRKVLGPDYWRGRHVTDAFLASGVAYRPGSMVWGISPQLEVGVSGESGGALIQARHVIVATGAQERPFPIPGWTMPGVMTVGAAQILLKSSGLVPSGRVVLAGTGPLLMLYAAQVIGAGAAIDAVLDTTPRRNLAAALPYAPAFLLSAYARKGWRMRREVRRRVPFIDSVDSLAVVGGDRAEAVRLRSRGREMELAVDTLLLHQGVVPHVNLAMATGCRHEWDRTQLCWRPVVDAWGASSVVGVSVAGDGAGIEGAEAAEHAGRLAALDAAHRLDVLSRDRRDQIAQEFWAKRRLATVGRGFLDRWFRPHPEFRVPDDATIVCRCEEVTAGQIRDSVRLGCPGPNQMKAYLRCGMGPCQGRLCGLTVTEIMAEARGVSPTEVGYYRLRAPMKPVPLRDLAAWPKSAAGPAIPR